MVTQQTQEGNTEINGDEILLRVLGNRSGYFRGKGYGKKAPSKKGSDQEEVNIRVHQALQQSRQSFEESIREKLRDEVTEQIESRLNDKVEAMVQARLSSLMASLSQSNANILQVPLPQV